MGARQSVDASRVESVAGAATPWAIDDATGRSPLGLGPAATLGECVRRKTAYPTAQPTPRTSHTAMTARGPATDRFTVVACDLAQGEPVVGPALCDPVAEPVPVEGEGVHEADGFGGPYDRRSEVGLGGGTLGDADGPPYPVAASGDIGSAAGA